MSDVENDVLEEELSHEDDFDAAFEQALAEASGEPQEEQEEGQPPVKAKEDAPEDDGDPFRADQIAQIQQERQSQPDLALPQGWAESNPKLAEAWKGLPAELKAEVNRRERERTSAMHREITKAQEEYKKVAPISGFLKEIEPFQEKWALEKTPLGVVEALRQAVSVREYLKKTPNLELAKQFLKASGHGPEALIERGTDSTSDELRALREEVNYLKNGKQQELQQQQQQEVVQQQQQLSAHAISAYHRFAETRNAHGQLKYPSASQPGFAEAMGSLVSRRLQMAPGVPIEQHLAEVYAHMGGQIQTGNGTSSSNSNTQRLRAAAQSGYGKGGVASTPRTFDSVDDAWAATFEEYGLLE